MTKEAKFPLLRGKSLVFFLLSVLSASLFGYLMGASSASNNTNPTGRVLLQEEEETLHESHIEESGDEEEGEEGFWEFEDFSAIVIIVLALILLTILFEVAKEHLEESVSEDFEVILEKFFGELTVLGFLAMVTFLVSRTGLVQRISEHVFGKEEELVEYIEYVSTQRHSNITSHPFSLIVDMEHYRVVHFALFFVMISFVIQVVMMLQVAEKQQDRWFEMDERIRLEHGMDMKQSERDEMQMALKKRRWYSIICDGFDARREELIFRALRREFILDRSLSKPFRPCDPEKRLSDTFNFGRYLGLAQVHVLSHVIEVHLSTWGFFAFMTVLFYVIAIALNFQIEVSDRQNAFIFLCVFSD